jgi:hypothetical protein
MQVLWLFFAGLHERASTVIVSFALDGEVGVLSMRLVPEGRRKRKSGLATGADELKRGCRRRCLIAADQVKL